MLEWFDDLQREFVRSMAEFHLLRCEIDADRLDALRSAHEEMERVVPNATRLE